MISRRLLGFSQLHIKQANLEKGENVTWYPNFEIYWSNDSSGT